ncbi:heavy metal-binding domain-containing protein [Shewanella sp. UCD-KL12]|uniref:heavy metal-binding domain-containing protein n=1 Tax=Shewanella sp. UCD-KL12 TaxID=1917163 RepID=UPI000970D428|nr:heavy metal-binding domain-containing protein [Shewanella sp. UCD-KL12]
MKTLISLVLSAFIFISIAPAATAGQHEHTQHKDHAQHHDMKADYDCPMHPEVTGKKGDTCPKCGMNLTKVESSHSKHKAGCGEDCKSCPNHAGKHTAKHSADTHACPMNPAITGKAGDTCHKCGMNLEPMQAKADTHACPMNPAITGKKGDTCPKCGMNLEPMQAKADTKPTVHHKH